MNPATDMCSVRPVSLVVVIVVGVLACAP